MLFIYGAHDPWSASAFTVDAVNDSYRFFVTGANGDHMASINELPAAQRTFVLQKLKDLAGSARAGRRAPRRERYTAALRPSDPARAVPALRPADRAETIKLPSMYSAAVRQVSD
jgi:hypothetical protein